METIKTPSKYSKFAKYRINALQQFVKNKKSTKLQSIIAKTTISISKTNSFQLTPKQSKMINDFQNQNICRPFKYKSRQNNCNNIQKIFINKERMSTTPNKVKEQREIIYQQSLQQLKKYVNSLSQRHSPKFNIARPHNDEKYNNITSEENKRFMKRELSFTQNDEEQINIQKQVLEQYENQRGIQNKKISVLELSQNKLAYLEIKITKCHKTIQKIYQCIKQMQRIGYERRSNQLIIAYCLNKGKLLSNIFLQPSKKDIDSISFYSKYLLVPCVKDANIFFSNYISKAVYYDINKISQDIERLFEYVQEILNEKKIVELQKVSQYLEDKINSVKRVNTMNSEFHIQYLNFHLQKIDQEKNNFMDNVERLEQKYGNIKQISKETRQRYQYLNQVYDRMHTLL